MRTLFKQILLQTLVFSTVLTLGCGSGDDSVDPADRLCQGESGFAAMISGSSKSVEMCVSNENTFTVYIPHDSGDRYSAVAAFEIDGVVIEIEMGFFVQNQIPAILSGTSNRAQAETDPGSMLFVYRETNPGNYVYESVTCSGAFTVTFNDASVAVVTFGTVDVDLEDLATNNPAGSRAISEGYLSVTPN